MPLTVHMYGKNIGLLITDSTATTAFDGPKFAASSIEGGAVDVVNVDPAAGFFIAR